MYPGIDRTKPPGIIPGMILNHPALHPDGRMRLDPCLALQAHLIEDYSKEDFQRKLYAGWHSTDSLVEKHKWRQAVCLEVQCQWLPQYGFEGSRRGVYASGVACNTSPELSHEACAHNSVVMELLVNPDKQEGGQAAGYHVMANWFFTPSIAEGEQRASGYEVCVTREHDDEAIFMIARCQGSLAGAHQAMYKAEYPDLEPQQWFGLLGVGKSVREAVEEGILIWHARALDTGRVVGYVSCTCFHGDGADARPHGQVNNIVVMKEHRGSGVGRMLFNELLDHLEVACPSIATDLRISVAERNMRAKEWYERLGFAETGDWVAYPNGHAVRFLRMRRSLEDIDDIFS